MKDVQVFKGLQRVATTAALRNEKGHPIGVGTHLTVIRQDGDRLICRQDKKEGHEGKAFRVIAKVSQVATTSPGRPKNKTTSRKGHGSKAPMVAEVSETVVAEA